MASIVESEMTCFAASVVELAGCPAQPRPTLAENEMSM